MKITSLEFWLVKMPLQQNEAGFFAVPARFYPSWIPGYPQTHMSFYLVRLKTDSGLEGVAAMNAIGAERASMAKMVAPYLIGLNPLDMGMVNQRIQEMSYIGLRNGWMDAAFWDIAGKAMGKPVWMLLGGEGGKVTAYCSTGTPHEPVENARIIGERRAQGFKALKLRVKDTNLDAMCAQVESARKAAGDDYPLMVDANQGWPVSIVSPNPHWNLDLATRFAQKMEDYNITWLEEPLNRGDVPGLQALRKATRTPIAGGELNGSFLEFQRLMEHDCLDIYQPDATLAGGSFGGGVSTSWWVMQEVFKKGQDSMGRPLKFCPHTWTNGIGFAVNLQLVGAMPASKRSFLEYPYEPPFSGEWFFRPLLTDFSLDKDGAVKIPDAPGLGIELNWNEIRRFGKRLFACDKKKVAISTVLDRKLKVALELKQRIEERDAQATEVPFSIPEPPFSKVG